MLNNLRVEANVFPDLPTEPEESWRRISPALFFLPLDESLNAEGKKLQEGLDFSIKSVKKLELSSKEMGDMLVKEKLCPTQTALEDLQEALPKATLVKIKNGIISIFSTKNAPELHFSEGTSPIESLIPESKISSALSQRMSACTGKTFVISSGKKSSERPLLILLLDSESPFKQSYSSLQIHAEADSELDLVYLVKQGREGLAIHRHELLIKENATVYEAWAVNAEAKETSENLLLERKVTLEKNAKLNDAHMFFSKGTARIQSRIVLVGEGAEATSSSAISLDTSSKLDFEPIQEHLCSRTSSSLKAKFLIADAARGVFQGLIKVKKEAKKCIALQDNKNLLLGKKARIEATPRLNIFPGEVVCKHGSATGEIDKKQLYYLETRGFSPEKAKEILVSGFIADGLSALDSNHTMRTMGEYLLK